ncbi:pyridoxamine 5'-phosphate oxidase family protein [Paenibacillus pasadenensis]|uniref:Putative general stress protein 26 n=1 Tax=Paenibacillus pasadenensis TaxID=217090 RepID=A0A2N5NCQ1_9BACL|nr:MULTISPECIES: pyridoxamine 5'-phosphate oxidase family protein [Paenibacillus]PLT48114.1 putative general stress protein 26 [Paenibacillus pasadenensis]QGG58364.1 general stress protein [Paenibacillus sp. B01]
MSEKQTTHEQAVEKVRELIDGIETAMLTTIAEEGLVSRPMKTQEIEFDGDLWFVTMKDTAKYGELRRDPRVNVAYAGKSFVSIRGKAEFVEDLEKKKAFWNKAYEKLLHASYDDPNVVLVKVNAEAAEYWDTANKFEAAKLMLHRLTGAGSGDSKLNETVELQ